MRTRTLGAVLLAVGLAGLLSLSLSAGSSGLSPGGGPGAMWQAHRWMHGGWAPGGDTPAAWTAPAPSPGAREVTLVARDLSFSPAKLEVEARETVNLVLRNEGAVLHDVTIPALGFRLVAGPGETAAAALTVPPPGSYGFYCSVPGHREGGMSGILVAS